MVGLIAGAEYSAAQCRVVAGERILLATDGVTEAENDARRTVWRRAAFSPPRVWRKSTRSSSGSPNSRNTIPPRTTTHLLDIRYRG
jgi:hypothetical protein